MMVMIAIAFVVADEFEAGAAITKVEAVDQPDILKHLHRSINRRQIATVRTDDFMDFANGQWMLFALQCVENSATRPCNLTGALPEFSGQIGTTVVVVMLVRVLFHGHGLLKQLYLWRA